MGALRLALGLFAAVAALGGSLAAAPAPMAWAAAQAAPRLYRMAAVQAYEPAWLPDGKRMVFFGNRQANEPVHVYLWEPLTGQIGRATATAATRHSLAVAEDGRLAYVEHKAAEETRPTGLVNLPQPGPDALIIQDLRRNTTQAVFTNGWVLPQSVAWSPDGKRLAFVTLDGSGHQRLAIVTPGQPVTLVQLNRPYEFQELVGWSSEREVLMRGAAVDTAGATEERLLLVGREGVRSYRSALAPKLSPDGRWLLARQSEAGGVALWLVTGGSRLLNAQASAYDWAPEATRVYAAIERDLVALDLKGRELRRWRGLANLALGQVSVSPDGRHVAFSADYGLTVLPLK